MFCLLLLCFFLLNLFCNHDPRLNPLCLSLSVAPTNMYVCIRNDLISLIFHLFNFYSWCDFFVFNSRLYLFHLFPYLFFHRLIYFFFIYAVAFARLVPKVEGKKISLKYICVLVLNIFDFARCDTMSVRHSNLVLRIRSHVILGCF